MEGSCWKPIRPSRRVDRFDRHYPWFGNRGDRDGAAEIPRKISIYFHADRVEQPCFFWCGALGRDWHNAAGTDALNLGSLLGGTADKARRGCLDAEMAPIDSGPAVA